MAATCFGDRHLPALHDVRLDGVSRYVLNLDEMRVGGRKSMAMCEKGKVGVTRPQP